MELRFPDTVTTPEGVVSGALNLAVPGQSKSFGYSVVYA
jgi:hypothetical protein